jgi:hypothetical protein
MRPYPWYEINGLTLELEPYALYTLRRTHFERCYQPEPSPDGAITVQSLKDSILGDKDSILGDDERYGWMSGDTIMRGIVHKLRYDPDALEKLAQIDKEYMSGFSARHYIDQARIHMMSARLVLGETYEDAAVTKRLLRLKTLDLWAFSWLRMKGNFFPDAAELEDTLKILPPVIAGKFHWPEVFSNLGLSDLPEFGEQTHKPGPGVFSWTMRSDPRITRLVPEHREDVASLLDASMRSIYSIVSAKVLEACSRVPPRLPR